MTDLAQGTAILISWAKYTKQVADAGGKSVPIPRQFPWPDRKRLLPEVEGPLPLEEIVAVNKTLDRFSLLDPTDPEKLVEDIGNLFLKADVSEANPDQGNCSPVCAACPELDMLTLTDLKSTISWSHHQAFGALRLLSSAL